MLTAIIGGSGFYEYEALNSQTKIELQTPYGSHSKPLIKGKLNDTECVFIPRHCWGHKIPPHKVNYRANLWALNQLKVTNIIGTNVVGGISKHMMPGTLLLPDQLIDYTYGREHSFFDGNTNFDCDTFQITSHVDFTEPYSPQLRKKILNFFSEEKISSVSSGVYGCVQGPRLETAAEIQRLKKDGCDVVGMTTMPEAALARELGIHYAALTVVVNWAAGIKEKALLMDEIIKTIEVNMMKIKEFLPNMVREL